MAVPELAASPLVVFLFLLLATLAQLLLALYGLLSRYLQVISAPPVPALRLVVVVNLLAEAALLLFHAAPRLAVAAERRRRRRLQRDRLQPELPTTQLAGADIDAKGAGQQPLRVEEECTSRSSSSSSSDHGSSGLPGAAQQQRDGQPAAAGNTPPPAAAAAAAAAALEAAGSGGGGGGARRLLPARSTLRPPVVLARGISRRFEAWQQRRPLLHRRLAVAAITLTFMGCCSLQILAPGFVDVSIVQLTTQWTTLGIALAQALLLRQALPRTFWPCAAAMLGGAAMVIVPSVGQSTAGSLNSARGWWGLVMAVGALVSTVIYYTLLQATRHMGLTALHLQHYMCITSILFFSCLSLPIDGTDWAAQFVGWGAADWASLVSLSTAAYIGSGTLMQLCVWRLGAPTAAMFFGLRLVFAVILSEPILGSTVIQTGLQIAGVVITAIAVTCYAASQWWSSRQVQREQQQQADAAAAAAPAGSVG